MDSRDAKDIREEIDVIVQNVDTMNNALWTRMDHHSNMFMVNARTLKTINEDVKSLISTVDRLNFWLTIAHTMASVAVVLCIGIIAGWW